MATRIREVILTGPDGFYSKRRDIEADDTVWIKHLNDIGKPLRLRIGESAHVSIVSASDKANEREAIGFNTMQDGVFITELRSQRVGPAEHVHSFTIEARYWNESDDDPDPLTSMVIRIHTSYPGVSGLTSRDMRLHVLVMPKDEYAADVNIEGAATAVDAPAQEEQELIELEEVDLDKMTIADLIAFSDQGRLFYQVE